MNRTKMVNYKKMKGFSLIEALIAISILLVGILSAFALVTKSLASAPIIQDRLVASFLAQEKLEQIRQIRDTNFLKILNREDGGSWTSDRWKDSILSHEHELSDQTPIIMNGTQFMREVSVTQKDPNVHLIIECKITWETKGHEYSFIAEDHLFNWIHIDI